MPTTTAKATRFPQRPADPGPPPGFLHEVLEAMPDAVTISTAVRDRRGRAVDLRLDFMNAAARARQPQPERAVGRLCSELWPGLVRTGTLTACLRTLESGEPAAGAFEWTDGERFRPGGYEFRASRLGRDTLVWVLRDVTERLRHERELADSEARLRAAFEDAPMGMALLGHDGACVAANAALHGMLGLPRGAPPRRLGDFVEAADRDCWQERCEAALDGIPQDPVTVRLRHARGPQVVARIGLAAVHGPAGEPPHVVAHVQDVTERERVRRELARAATHDALTGLPNRALLIDRLQVALARRDRAVALMLVDLDHFKVINDSLGHLVGDQVLQEAAARLRSAVRPSDTIARLGGDEFVVLCDDVNATDLGRSTRAISTRIAERLAVPMALDGRTASITASVGIAFAGDGETTPVALLRDADLAMYAAKDGGRGRAVVFDAHLRSQALARMDVASDLRWAARRGELLPHFQPIRDLETQAVVAVEALMRWHHRDGRLLAPDAFLEVAEQTGQIVPLGEHVAREACRQVAQWRTSGECPDLALTLNCSPQQIAAGDFVPRLFATLEQTRLPPRALIVEITEQTLMLASASASERLEELRRAGVRVALDDFGTGFSSLGYLQQLPVDILKTDRTFMANSPSDDGKLLCSIVALAEALKLMLVAEGVESAENRELLTRCGGRYGQGYDLGVPVPAGRFVPARAGVDPAGPHPPPRSRWRALTCGTARS